MKTKLVGVYLLLSAGLVSAADFTTGMSKGSPALKSVSAMAFGPDGVLFLGDPMAGSIFAVSTGDSKPDGKGELNLEKLDTTLADMLGVKAPDVQVNDVKVNPASGQVYLAATRKGKDGGSLVFKISRDGKFAEVPLKDVLFSELKLPNAAEKNRALAITSMSFVGGKLVVAGLSNEEFASTLRAITFPFKDADKGTAVEIYHAAHNALETRSPIQTFVPYQVSGADYLIASYTCTPLVRVPVTELKAGEKIKGTTVAELGNMNRPLDIIIYSKDKKDYALMANDRRGVMKISLEGIDKAEPITAAVRGGGTAGTAFEKVESLTGVKQLDRLDNEHALLLVEAKDKSLALKTVKLP